MGAMSSTVFRVRRATVDDLPALKALWESMRIYTADLEKHLTEFQVAVDADGRIVGAIGFQIIQRHGLIHSEGFADFAVADQVRPLWWTRIQSLATNHGIARLWTRENAPFWTHSGLQPAEADALSRLPETWDRTAPGWRTLALKDETALASLDQEFDLFVASEKRRSADALGQARKLKTIVSVLGLLLALGLGAATVYIVLTHRLPALPQ